MCGFIVLKSGSTANDAQVRRRGPDASGVLSLGGLDFQHFLLHVTGAATPQPFQMGDIVCVYNGEIYNQPYAQSDGEVLIPLYRRHGVTFAQHLDGEFAIALYDFSKQIAVFATDPFGTKPLFVRGTECASYRSAVAGERVPPNTTWVRDFSGVTRESLINYPFDFGSQTKPSYDDWMAAFSASVKKRAKQGCFITLSSGYDSGVIACELSRQGVDFHAYSIRADERLDVLDARLAQTRGTLFELSLDDYEQQTAFLRKHCEPASFSEEAGMELHCDDLFHDPGAVGASFIFSRAGAHGHTVHLSGHGGDEIFSDYAGSPGISSLHGVFPEELRPWKNFQGGCMRAYLAKEEHVAGSHGIETRYPLLDASLVQEFLWLTPELKNRHYKAPLREYFQRHDYPFVEGSKVGFAAHLNLKNWVGDARLEQLFSWILDRQRSAEAP